jgi:hypothetical protein
MAFFNFASPAASAKIHANGLFETGLAGFSNTRHTPETKTGFKELFRPIAVLF